MFLVRVSQNTTCVDLHPKALRKHVTSLQLSTCSDHHIPIPTVPGPAGANHTAWHALADFDQAHQRLLAAHGAALATLEAELGKEGTKGFVLKKTSRLQQGSCSERTPGWQITTDEIYTPETGDLPKKYVDHLQKPFFGDWLGLGAPHATRTGRIFGSPVLLTERKGSQKKNS